MGIQLLLEFFVSKVEFFIHPSVILFDAIGMVEPTVFFNRYFLVIGFLIEIIDILVVHPDDGLSKTKVFADILLQVILEIAVLVVL